MMKNNEIENSSFSRETAFEIDAFDGKKIACWLNRAGDKPAPKAVILSHGLTGNPNEYIHMMARNYFNERGYDVYRFAYYWSEPQNRLLHECTLDIHARDLNSVLGHVRPDHEKFFICGHSYGGLTMIFAQPDATAISFWDSSYAPDEWSWRTEVTYLKELDCYAVPWGSLQLIGKAMYEEYSSLPFDKLDTMTGSLKAPSQVVAANAEISAKERSQKLYDALRCEKNLCIIEDGDHCFVKGDIIYNLLDKTYEWFERF